MQNIDKAWFEKFCDALEALGYDTPRHDCDGCDSCDPPADLPKNRRPIGVGIEDYYVQELVAPMFKAGASPEAAAAHLEVDGKAGAWGYY